jgi:hypothetical protein
MQTSEKNMSIINFLYNQTNITPKYIIFCIGDKRKMIYQYYPTEIITKNGDKQIIHNAYIQNTINNKHDINDYTHAIIISENNEEFIIKEKFYLENMFNDIQNTFNRKYTVSYVINIPISIKTEYDNNDNKHQITTNINKKKIGIIGAFLAMIGIGLIGKKIL